MFQQRWKTDKQYKTWIAPNAKHKNKLVCKLCQKAIYLTRMGESALTSHMKGAKHRELLAESSLDSFVTVANESAAVAVTRAEQPTELGTVATGDSSEPLQAGPSSRAPSIQPIQGSTCTISSVAHNADLKAETLWALNVVAKTTLSRDAKVLVKFFVLCFQIVRLQSLNDVVQSKQMDVLVRFWDGTNVCTRYYTSKFLGHAVVETLQAEFYDCCRGLGLGGIHQLSMDVPNVNWKTFDLLSTQIEKGTQKKLLNTGSRGLHIIHNTFCAGIS